MRRAEVERIHAAYAGYDSRPAELRKRAPENPGNAAMGRELRAALDRWLTRSGLDLGSARILDAGCGRGGLVARLVEGGARAERIVGVDLLPDRIEAARAACPDATFIRGDIAEAGLAPATFDLACCVTLFGSLVAPDSAASVAATIGALLRPGGFVLWCDSRYPNPWNPNVRGWTRGQVARLFPGFEVRLEPVTLLPPLARRLGPLTRFAYPPLGWIRPLRARHAGLIRRPPSALVGGAGS